MAVVKGSIIGFPSSKLSQLSPEQSKPEQFFLPDQQVLHSLPFHLITFGASIFD